MPGRDIVGKIKMDDVRKIAEIKMPDLNAFDLIRLKKLLQVLQEVWE